MSTHAGCEVTRRDRVAVALTNTVLRLATPYYRNFLAGAIEYGMRAAAADRKAGRPFPPDWRTPTGAQP